MTTTWKRNQSRAVYIKAKLGRQPPRRNPSPLKKVERRPYEFAEIQDPEMFKPKGFGRVARAEPHHFANASQEHGFGTVSYCASLLIKERYIAISSWVNRA